MMYLGSNPKPLCETHGRYPLLPDLALWFCGQNGGLINKKPWV